MWHGVVWVCKVGEVQRLEWRFIAQFAPISSIYIWKMILRTHKKHVRIDAEPSFIIAISNIHPQNMK